MTPRRRTPRALRRDTRAASRAIRQPRSAQQIQEFRAHMLRVLTKTAIATAAIGGIFLLTSSHTLHQMAAFLFAWSGGWAAADVSLRIQRLVKHGRRRDER